MKKKTIIVGATILSALGTTFLMTNELTSRTNTNPYENSKTNETIQSQKILEDIGATFLTANELVSKTETNYAATPQTQFQNTLEDKEKIQTLMLNSIDHFTSAKGSLEYLSTTGNYNLLIEYQVDLSNNPKSFEKVVDLTYQEDGFGTEFSIYDGEDLINYKTNTPEGKNDKNKKPSKHIMKGKKITKEEKERLKGSKMKDRIIESGGEKGYMHRTDPSYMGIAKTSLFPEDIAMGFLENTEQWNITGQEVFAGVNTVVIEGALNSSYSERYNAQSFKLNIDPNTGIMLQMVVTDHNKAIKELIKTSNIKINGTLDDKLYKSVSKD